MEHFNQTHIENSGSSGAASDFYSVVPSSNLSQTPIVLTEAYSNYPQSIEVNRATISKLWRDRFYIPFQFIFHCNPVIRR